MHDDCVVVLAQGSTSEHKKTATDEAVVRLIQDHSRMGKVDRPGRFLLPCYPTKSGVGEEPMGLSAVSLGAVTRASRALRAGLVDRATPPGAYVLGLGVESGMECVHGHWLDLAVVAVVREGMLNTSADSLVGLSTSLGLPFPAQYVAMALQDEEGLSRHTAGSKVALVLGGDKTDPHSTLTRSRITRARLLADAIYAALVQVPGL